MTYLKKKKKMFLILKCKLIMASLFCLSLWNASYGENEGERERERKREKEGEREKERERERERIKERKRENKMEKERCGLVYEDIRRRERERDCKS